MSIAMSDFRVSFLFRTFLLICVFGFFTTTSVWGQDQERSTQQVIEASLQPHPRLLFTPQRQQRLEQVIRQDPLQQALFDFIRQHSDAMQEVEPVERKLNGRRMLGQSRRCLKRVSYLALTYRLTGEQKYFDRAKQEMLAAAAFADWNPRHFLDVGEMTTAMAIGYDWLYDDLDPTSRETIRNAIIEKGLKASLGDAGYLWWIDSKSNWTQVCHAGMVLGALAVFEDEPELATQVIDRALKYIKEGPMQTYAPHGAYPEGPGYWSFGTTYNVLMIDGLLTATGDDFGLMDSPGFMQSADFMLQMVSSTGGYFNFGDNGSRTQIQPAMYWFAMQRDAADLLWHEKNELQTFLAEEHNPAGSRGTGRLAAFILIWSTPFEAMNPPSAVNWANQGDRPVLGIHRTGWKNDDVFVGVKGGQAGVSHGHMDVGSFIIEADGVRWGIDLGPQNYNQLELAGVDLWDGKQNGGRWTVFRLNNFSHNTLVVNGELQRVDGKAPIVDFSDDADAPHTILDLSEVYQGQLAQAKRGVGLREGGAFIVVQDELKATEKPAEVRWGMVTSAGIEIQDDHHAVLKKDGKTLQMQIISPTDAKWRIDPMDPPAEYDAENRSANMICFNANLKPDETQRLVVAITPGESSQTEIQVTPLASW